MNKDDLASYSVLTAGQHEVALVAVQGKLTELHSPADNRYVTPENKIKIIKYLNQCCGSGSGNFGSDPKKKEPDLDPMSINRPL